MVKVHCLNKISKIGTSLFTDSYELTENMQEAEAILVRSAAMQELSFSPTLKAIARAGAGVNNIPLDRCAEENIVVFNTPGANANGVKELALAGLLLAARDIVGGISWVQTISQEDGVEKLVEKGKSSFAGTEIKGKSLGIIGLGAIGALIANAAIDLGMNVYGCDPYLSVDGAWKLSPKVQKVKTRDEIFACCDYISVHTPLVSHEDPSINTKGMINEQTISKMKDGVVILNFARDLLVDDEAIETALASGKVKRYVTDFPNSKTAGMKGVIAIPHLGASTEESEDNCAKMAVEQVMNFIEHGNIVNSVNYPACDLGEKKGEIRIALHYRENQNILAAVTPILGELGINVIAFAYGIRDAVRYCLMDCEGTTGADIEEVLKKIPGIQKVTLF